MFSGAKKKNNNKGNTTLEQDLSIKEPIRLFSEWFQEACNRKEIIHPSAMCLATVSENGMPSARFVILKYYDDKGFKFFTDFRSQKAQDIAQNCNVAATFYWDILNRSIRIEGQAEKLSDKECDKYFYSWPIRSQLRASASHMSAPIETITTVYEKMIAIEAEKGTKIPRPSHWGGYVIRPSAIEFWEEQKERLPNRIRFRRLKAEECPDNKILKQGENDWFYERLSP